MEYKTKEVADGIHVGKEVWICDFRYTDFNNKPIRHVKPTKVLIRSNTETSKTIYYSNCFFSEFKKDGSVSRSSLIKLYDNTGYRSFPGVALRVFNNEKDCVKVYKDMALVTEKLFDNWREEKLNQLRLVEQDIQAAVMYNN